MAGAVLVWLVPGLSIALRNHFALAPYGRVVERGSAAPFRGTAVVLDAAVADPAAPVAYAPSFRNLRAEPVRVPADVRLWLWVDPAGHYHTNLIAKGVPYRASVHREGCRPEPVGTHFFGASVRRLDLEVGRCRPAW